MTMAAAGVPDADRLHVVIVIARYPPHHRGGYELRCRDVSRELARRGHRVTVLTSRAGERGVFDDGGVRVVRELHLWEDGVPNGAASLLRFVRRTVADCAALRRELGDRGAHVLAYWHQSGLTSALLAVTPPRGTGVLCDVSSDWLLDAAVTGGNWFRIWEAPSRSGLRGAVKSVFRSLAATLGAPVTRPAFPPGKAYYTSADRRSRHGAAGVDVSRAVTIRSGVNLSLFSQREAEPAAPPRKVLFLSRIKRWKGLHTAVLATSFLPPDVHLEVVGAVDDPEYLAEVGEMVAATGLSSRVRICPQVDHAQIPEILRSAHALVFGSETPEPFSRLVLEAFACGTPVVGTTIGGTGEVLLEDETGLTYSPGNARELADQLARLFGDDALRAGLIARAHRLVEERYSLTFTVDSIETLLREAHAAAAR